MSNKKVPFALIYDFNGTLAPGNLKDHNFIPGINTGSKDFRAEIDNISKKYQADKLLVYMKLMLDKAKSASIKVTKSTFETYGENISLFDGLTPYFTGNTKEDDWFDRINKFGLERGIKVEHYIVSTGIREMIEGTKIAGKFKRIYSSSYLYDKDGIAEWPSLIINSHSKPGYLIRINKGILGIDDNKPVYESSSEEQINIPFKNMIYFGDGTTDIPCFKFLKDRGGHSIAVYDPEKGNIKAEAQKFNNDIVNFICPADYSNGSKADVIVKGILNNMC